MPTLLIHIKICMVDIPARPLYNCDIVSMYFNHFPCMGICNKLSRHLSMLTYIYLNVDECWLTSSMPQQNLNSKFLLIMVNFNKMWFLEWYLQAFVRTLKFRWKSSILPELFGAYDGCKPFLKMHSYCSWMNN